MEAAALVRPEPGFAAAITESEDAFDAAISALVMDDHLADLAKTGVRSVVIAPIGFVSDHMEVRQDLDVEAARTAQSLGLAFARVATPGVRLAPMIGELVREHLAGAAPLPCPAGCCLGPA